MSDHKALLLAAKERAAAGDVPGAVAMVEPLLEEPARRFDALVVLARIHLAQEDAAQADRLATAAAAMKPASARARLLAARTAARVGDVARARDHVAAIPEEAAEAEPGRALLRRVAQVGKPPLETKLALTRKGRARLPSAPLAEWLAAADTAELFATITAVAGERDLAGLFALDAALQAGGSGRERVASDFLNARLYHDQRCYLPALPLLDGLLGREDALAVLAEAGADILSEARKMRARALLTLGRADEIKALPDDQPDAPELLDVYWRQDPKRGLALARAAHKARPAAQKPMVLLCMLPLASGDLAGARRAFNELAGRHRLAGVLLPPELALAGARIALEHGEVAEHNRLIDYQFAAYGLERPGLDPTRGLAFDTLAVNLSSRAVRGPLVTVIMTAFQAADTLPHALGSLLHQSYADLEILVVDDCSGDGTAECARAVAAGDPRVTVFTTERNGGTYRAKNLALARATGRYVTTLDADDWAHPRRIELHVAEMEANPQLAASTSGWLRVDEAGRLLLRPTTGVFNHRNCGAAFTRREAVMESVGFYDRVRIEADADYWTRILMAFGPARVLRIVAPLTLGRFHSASLTRAGVGAQDEENYSPLRSEYRHQAVEWRRRQWAAGVFRLEAEGARPFPAPEEMLA